MNNIAVAYRDTGRIAESIQLYEKLRSQQTQKLGRNHPDTLTVVNNLAGAYQGAGRMAEAIELFEEVRAQQTKILGPDHPHTLRSVSNLGGAYLDFGRTSEAIQLFEQVRARRTQKLGPDHPHTLQTLGNLASALAAAKQFDRAIAMSRDWLDANSRKVPTDDLARAGPLALLGGCLLKAGRPVEAEPVLRECLAIREKKQPDVWTTFYTQSLLGGSLGGQQKYAEAEPLLQQGYQGMKDREAKIPFPYKIRLTEALERLVELYDAWGKPEQAKVWRHELEQAKTPAKQPAQTR
jgi:tetratricopeptide (TPR) repeat protein